MSGQLTINYHSSAGSYNQGAPADSWCGAWHTYGLYRKASSAEDYWDGKLVKSYSTNDNGAGQSLIVNIGSGGTADVSKPIQVDYVRAWGP